MRSTILELGPIKENEWWSGSSSAGHAPRRLRVRCLCSDQANDGELLETRPFAVQHCSQLFSGSFSQLLGGSGDPVSDRVRSFKLFRRKLNKPENIGFNELVVRPERYVEVMGDELTQADDIGAQYRLRFHSRRVTAPVAGGETAGTVNRFAEIQMKSALMALDHSGHLRDECSII